MTTMTAPTTTAATRTQVYRVYIKAEPERVWAAITSPEWTDRYGYGGPASSTCGSRRAPRTGTTRARRCGR